MGDRTNRCSINRIDNKGKQNNGYLHPWRSQVRIIHSLLYAGIPNINQVEYILPSHVITRQPGKSPVFSLLKKTMPLLQKDFGVKRIGIFGSFARGEQKPTSDIDVLVEFEQGQATFDNFMRLAFYLEDLFSRKVDLLTVMGIDRYIRSRVEHEVIWIEG